MTSEERLARILRTRKAYLQELSVIVLIANPMLVFISKIRFAVALTFIEWYLYVA